VIRFGLQQLRGAGRGWAFLAAVLLASSCVPPPQETQRIVALAESPEITLTVINSFDEAIRFVGPAGNTFDVLAGESLSLRLVVVSLAPFDEDMFRPWLVPVGQVQQLLAELDEPRLVHNDGLEGQLDYVSPEGALVTLRLTARRCPGRGWRAPGIEPAEFVVRAGPDIQPPVLLCPGGAA